MRQTLTASVVACTLLAASLWAQQLEVIDAMPATSGQVGTGKLSSDGTKMLWLERRASADRIGVRLLDLASRKMWDLIDDTAPAYQAIDAGPDGMVYFTQYDVPDRGLDLFRISLTGGEKQKVVRLVEDLHLSPDGKQILFRRKATGTAILIADANGKNERTLLDPSPRPFRSVDWDRSAAGLVRLTEWTKRDEVPLAWTVNIRTREKKDAPAPGAKFDIEQAGARGVDFRRHFWGPICRRSANGKVLEKLTPENDAYVRVLGVDRASRLLVFKVRPQEFWEGLKTTLGLGGRLDFDLVTLKVNP